MQEKKLSRRPFLKAVASSGGAIALEALLPSWSRLTAQNTPASQLSGDEISLTLAETEVRIGARSALAKTINGMLPGPLIRLREGQDVTLKVTNRLKESSSIHWHGVLVPAAMDGVPGVSFAGIKPGETFIYKFRIKQYGTYWYHSHSPGQEQAGVYAPLIFDPIKHDPVQYDREYVIVLSDWSSQAESAMISRLKKRAGYFNFQQRTLRELMADIQRYGWKATTDNYMMWARMRMEATDLADATANVYTYLMNGRSAESNWTGLFTHGERVRLRFINVGAMTFHDIRIPGLKMTIVQADGQNVQPVEVDEFRFGPAETYDVIVTPTEDRAYTIFSETLDRSGYTRGTLAPRVGVEAALPERRPRPLRMMTDMGMVMPEGKEMPGMQLEMDKNMRAGGKMAGMQMTSPSASRSAHEGHGAAMKQGAAAHDMSKMGSPEMGRIPGSMPILHGPDMHGSGNQTIPQVTRARLDDPGIGLGGSGRKVLAYTDLKALEPFYDTRQPQRELEIHLTGHMERFIWSLDGKKYSEVNEPVHFRLGERLRWTFVNDTMMEHTMHLHGMWMHLENGAGDFLPRKHTVLVKPAERLSVAITPDALGPWAFHCHLIMHMEAGMFRVVLVT
jgi:CopA family copper-resistance protein